MKFRFCLVFILLLITGGLFAQCPTGTTPTSLNLVVNGNFNAGNTGFSSGYIDCQDSDCLITSPGGGAGYYGVGNNAHFFHPNFKGTDHTTGTGNFMVVNGASVAGVSVWCETINITPNTQYLFATWIISVNEQSPAILSFSINGVQIGSPIDAPGSFFYNTWVEFNATWNSGTDTVATICIVNENTAANGNDFGLDDISFSPCACSFTTSVTQPQNICSGTYTTLSAQAGATSYQWSPSAGLSSTTARSVTAAPSDSTVYTLIATLNSCSDTVKTAVDVYPPFSASAGNNDTLCQGAPDTLFASGGISYNWVPPTGLNSDTIPNPILTAVSTTTYTVTITDANGCSVTEQVNINVLPAPNISAGKDTSVCLGGTTVLNATGGISYSWAPATGLSSATISNPTVTATNTTTYTVTGTDTIGCKGNDTVVVTVYKVNASAGGDTSICPGTSAVLNASGGIHYSWSPDTGLSSNTIPNPVVTITGTTTYTVVVTDSHNCTASSEVTVNVYPPIISSAGADTTKICLGISVTLFAHGGANYLWSPAGTLNDSISANPVAKPLTTTTYTVVITDDNNCSVTKSVTINVSSLPFIIAGPDTLICIHDALTLSAHGGVNYQWTGPEIMSSSNDSIIEVGTNSTSVYSVKVTNAGGCSASASVNVVINTVCSFVALPSAFTPNNDGLNDLFRPKGMGVVTIQYEIYDRWGKKIYTGYDMNGGWNGTFNGKDQPIGVYSWQLDATLNDGRTVKDQGNVTLIR